MRSHTKKARRTLTVLTAALLAVTFLLPVGASASDQAPWEQITGILRDTMEREEFYWDLYQEPLACKSDADGDGVWELLTVFPVKWAQDPMVWMYSQAWLIDASTGEVRLAQEGTLYSEVGGNGGDVSLAEKDGKLFVMYRSSTPDGTDFHESYYIETLNEEASDEGWELYLLFANGTYGAEDEAEYWFDTRPISRQEYEDYLDDFNILYTMDPLVEPDPDSGFDVVPFNTLLM